LEHHILKFIKYFTDITLQDVPLVGGKNGSLGQMIRQLASKGIKVPLGFAVTTKAYGYFLTYNNLVDSIKSYLSDISSASDTATVQKIGNGIRQLIINSTIPDDLSDEIDGAYSWLSKQYREPDLDTAVRSSATAEDLPRASFAGQQDTYLHIQGIGAVLEAYKKCIASLFTDRAIVYRIEQGFDHFAVSIAVGVQKMVRSDKASSGVMFSLDTETGFKNVVVINSAWGLGESIVKGIVNPDEFHVHKPTLEQGFRPIIKKYLGSKKTKVSYSSNPQEPTITADVELDRQKKFSLTDDEILYLARQALIIEQYYSSFYDTWYPVDIEWAKDGIDQELYIVQARPETVYAHIHSDTLISYHLRQSDQQLTSITTGHSIGQKIAHGTARVLTSIKDYHHFNEGDILVTTMTDPDWVPIMKKAAGILTDNGGRTCHAAIVSRELGIPAIVGTTNGTDLIKNGDPITIDCSQGAIGYVYPGILDFTVEKVELKVLPKAPVPIFINMGDPDHAYKLSFLPVDGVGLTRIEFTITSFIKVHPMAISHMNKLKDPSLRETINELSYAYSSPKDFYIEKLAQGIGTIAAAFYPRTVIVRLSDFKSNEYRNLLGGGLFEPLEENPMLGFRGAVRYCNPYYEPAFALECAALRKVRNEMGLINVTIMVPFVRTLNEAECTLQALAQHHLIRHVNDLKVIMMCEVPSNVLLLEQFSPFFDGFSIGSNDLTQLTLGVDRDSALLSQLFDERDPAVKKMLEMALQTAQKAGAYISICGQAPSDFPEIADFLIEKGIKALSLNPDSVIPFFMRYKTKLNGEH
jgi:pyruvate, water dikinase